MPIQQIIPFTHWPSGDERSLAVLAFEIPELETRYGLTFAPGSDDLNENRFVVIRLNDGQPAFSAKYNQDPNPGVPVHVDAKADVVAARRSLLRTLDLDETALLWAAEPIEPGYATA